MRKLQDNGPVDGLHLMVKWPYVNRVTIINSAPVSSNTDIVLVDYAWNRCLNRYAHNVLQLLPQYSQSLWLKKNWQSFFEYILNFLKRGA